jgi:hypothetical protein
MPVGPNELARAPQARTARPVQSQATAPRPRQMSLDRVRPSSCRRDAFSNSQDKYAFAWE